MSLLLLAALDDTLDLVVDPYVPTAGEIGTLLRSRTDDGRGDQLGTFTDATRPTYAEVQILAAEAAGEVADRLGGNLPEILIPRARGAAALLAAVLVELGAYDPRQVVVDSLTKMAETRLKALEKEVAQAGAGDDPGPVDDLVEAVYSFDCVDDLPETF